MRTADLFRRLLTPVLLLFAAGCAAIPAVTDPASAAELTAFTAAMDQAAGTGRTICTTQRYTYAGSLAELNIPVRRTACWRNDPPGYSASLQVEGMPLKKIVYNGTVCREIIDEIGSRALPPAERESLLIGWRMLDWRATFAEAFSELAMDREIVEFNGVACRRLVGRFKAAPSLEPVEFFVSVNDKLIRRTRTVAVTDLGRIPVTIDHLDYRLQHGVMLPAHMIMEQLGTRLELRLENWEFDPRLPDETFTIAEDEI